MAKANANSPYDNISAEMMRCPAFRHELSPSLKKEINRKSKHMRERSRCEFRLRSRSKHVPYQGWKIRMLPESQIHWIPLDDCRNSVWMSLWKTYRVERERCIK